MFNMAFLRHTNCGLTFKSENRKSYTHVGYIKLIASYKFDFCESRKMPIQSCASSLLL